MRTANSTSDIYSGEKKQTSKKGCNVCKRLNATRVNLCS
uniref:Uncharacterized protein n=1 Tax=Anguilla anguilla TaxID=7936 RepID=A0A0E9T5G4_ANGAN